MKRASLSLLPYFFRLFVSQAAAMEEKMTQMMAAMAAATPAPAAVAEKAEDFDGHYISGDDWSKLMDRITKLENKAPAPLSASNPLWYSNWERTRPLLSIDRFAAGGRE